MGWTRGSSLGKRRETRTMNSDCITILMADDDPDDCMCVGDAFNQLGVKNRFVSLQDGNHLMDYLKRRGGYGDCSFAPRPDLILLDLNMPRKNGREALKEIKEHPCLRTIPVVVLTTSREESDIALCYDLGASSFIPKPTSYSELMDVVRTIAKYWFEVVALPPGIDPRLKGKCTPGRNSVLDT